MSMLTCFVALTRPCSVKMKRPAAALKTVDAAKTSVMIFSLGICSRKIWNIQSGKA